MQIIRKHQQHTFMQAFKRNTKKKGFFKKSAAVLLTAVLLLTGGRFDLIAGAIADSLPPADLVYVVRELTEYRTETGKVYLKSDGTLEAVMSAYPIHFKKDASSDWEEIDQTLKAVTVDGEQMYENTNAPFRVRLPGELDPGAAVELTDGASAISIQLLDHQNSAAKKVPKKAKASKKQQKGMTGAQVAKENLNQYDSIEYSEVYSDTDIRYELDPGALKESIVLHSKPHPHASYRYRITADGMNAGLNPDGSVDYYPDSTAGTNAADTQAVFHMPAPFMYDQSGEISYDIVTALEQEADSYILTYTPSKDWLRDSARVYPVVLDPSVVVNSAIQDAYTYSAAEYLDTYLGYEQQLKVGKSAWKGDCDWFETYVKFTELPAIPFDEYTVDSALLMLTPKQSYGAWEEMTIGAFEVLEDWKNHTNGTVSERLTWNNRPQTAEYEVATAHFTRNFTGSDAEGFEIAGLVEQWYQSPETNHGVRLSMTSETTNPWDSITFHSSRSEYAPFLTVTYTEYVPVTGITITDLPQDNRIPYGYHNAVHALSVEVYPENATNKNVIWESDNPAVAYVWDGFVSPETSGTVTITARSADREEVLDSVTLTVYTIPVESISITGRPEDDNLPDGESVQLAVTILPENVTDGVDFWQRNTQWSSSDPSVASVDSDGLVTAHSPGTVTITAEVHFYGVSDSFTLTVPRVPVTNIYLANSNGQETITEGSSLYICPVVRPETATNQTLLWVSDNPTVATASAANCTIYAHAPGNATITLMAESDPTVTAEIEVTVFPMTVELNRPSGDTLIKGQSWQLATNPNVRISAGNSDIVTVGENGWITANKTGRVTLEVWWAHDPGGFMRYELVVSTAFSIAGRPENDTLYTQVTYTDIGAAYSADQYYEVLWDSSDPSVAKIEYDFVRGITTITTHSPGTTYISALIPELNAYDVFELTVIQCQLDNILFDPDSALADHTLYVGERGELSAEIFPAAFADQPLQWTSTEPEILQVMPITYTRAKVVAKAPGYAIVSVAHNGIPYNNFEVTVKCPTIQIGNLPSANRLKVGQTHTLTATTDPAGMTVTWKSGNTNVATVNSAGKITAKAAGTATISATVVRGGKSYTASFTLKVGEPVTGVWIDCPLTNYVIWAGSSCVLTAEVLPNNAYDKSVIWSSDDTSVATVSSNGILSAKKAGMTVIRAKSQADPSIGDYFVVEVRSSAITNLSINTPINGSLSDSIKENWYAFTPTKTDTYSFYSTGSIDVMGSLYQGEYTLIASDSNSGISDNFCIAHPLTAGTTYYLKVTGITTTVSGSYSVCVLPSNYGSFSATATDYPVNAQRLTDMQRSDAEFDNWPASSDSRYSTYSGSQRAERLIELKELAIATCLGGAIRQYKDAADALMHFLNGSGTNYNIDVKRLCEEVPDINNMRKSKINELLAASENIVPVGTTRTIYNSEIDTFCIKKIQNNTNWQYTLGGCEFRIKAMVTRSSNNQFTATVEFGVIDFYDWNKDDTSMGNLPVSPRDLWELHHGGVAKNFLSVGSCTVQIVWAKGERWDTGAFVSVR